MKTKISAAMIGTFLLLSAAQTFAVVVAPTSITSVATNITNNGSALVSDVPSSSIPGGNSPQVMFDWLASGGSIDPGQIARYNFITSSALPQPIGSNPFIIDPSGESNPMGYSLTGSFYAVVHYGKGSGGEANSAVAWYLPSFSGSYSFPQNGIGTNGKGGISSVRIWETTSNKRVPDGGSTVAALGFALFGLGITRKLIGSRA